MAASNHAMRPSSWGWTDLLIAKRNQCLLERWNLCNGVWNDHLIGIAHNDFREWELSVLTWTYSKYVIRILSFVYLFYNHRYRFCQTVHVININRQYGGCFTNVSRALHNNLANIYNAENDIYGENFKLKLCTCAQSMALGTRTKCQLEIRIRSTISAVHKIRENILESSRNVSETTQVHGLSLIQAWTNKHVPNKVWDEIAYLSLNFNGATVEV